MCNKLSPLFCSYALRRDRDRNYLTVNYLHQRRCGNSNDRRTGFVSFNALAALRNPRCRLMFPSRARFCTPSLPRQVLIITSCQLPGTVTCLAGLLIARTAEDRSRIDEQRLVDFWYRGDQYVVTRNSLVNPDKSPAIFIFSCNLGDNYVRWENLT